MGRKQNKHRPPNNQGLPRRNPVAAKTDSQRTVAEGPARGQNRHLALVVCGFLLLAVGLVFGQTTGYPFVNFDDDCYVYENPQISGGLTAGGVAWVFTHEHGANWHPLTGLSHLLDCQLFGLHAGAHHLTSVLLQAATVVLLFLVLWRMTGRLWPSAMVAALFAVHPLRVESVAWISERKDILSGLCFVLTLAAYVHYVRSPFSLARYLLLAVVFALGLMAKPMLVTVPFVLLLLDYWPLGRFASTAHGGGRAGGANSLPTFLGRFPLPWQLLLEKLPLLALATASCLATLWAQGRGEAMKAYFPLGSRIANALMAYVDYLAQFFYPVGLVAHYPHPAGHVPVWKVFGSLVVLVCLSLGAIAYRRRYPYLLVSWLWYLGMLVPVIGIVQVGTQAMADRYTYLPQIGLCLALTWAAFDLCRSWSYRGWAGGLAAALVLAVLMGCAWRQTGFWCDSETLWTHALACTSSNAKAHNNLGIVFIHRGQVEEAMAQYQKVLELQPDNAEVHSNLGNALGSLGRIEEAMAHYRKSLELKPDNAEAHTNFGYILTRLGHFDEAMDHYRKALAINPNTAELQNNVALALAGQGRLDEAVKHYEKSLAINPDYVTAHNGLGLVLAARGRPSEAIAQYRQALAIQPDCREAHARLSNALLGLGQADEALEHLQKLAELSPADATARNNLGVVLAAQGRFDEALAAFQKALEIQPNCAEAWKNLGWLRATCPQASLRNGAEAIEHVRRADQPFDRQRADVLDVLAAAYAEAGRFPDALATARKALDLATRQKAQAMADVLRMRIALYEAGKPFHQTPPSGVPPTKH